MADGSRQSREGFTLRGAEGVSGDDQGEEASKIKGT